MSDGQRSPLGNRPAPLGGVASQLAGTTRGDCSSRRRGAPVFELTPSTSSQCAQSPAHVTRDATRSQECCTRITANPETTRSPYSATFANCSAVGRGVTALTTTSAMTAATSAGKIASRLRQNRRKHLFHTRRVPRQRHSGSRRNRRHRAPGRSALGVERRQHHRRDRSRVNRVGIEHLFENALGIHRLVERPAAQRRHGQPRNQAARAGSRLPARYSARKRLRPGSSPAKTGSSKPSRSPWRRPRPAATRPSPQAARAAPCRE